MQKERFKMKKRIIAILALATALAACGGATDTDALQDVTTQEVQEQAQQNLEALEPVDTYGTTLTVSNSAAWMGFDHFARMYMDQNPGVTIIVDDFGGDFMAYFEQIPLRLMAGTADDLIDAGGLDLRDPSTQMLLADWFPVMRADPTFNEDDFFMSVFDAFARDGRLFNLPTAFSPTRIAVNTTVPGLYDAIAGRQTITLSDMHELHQQFGEGRFIHDSYDAPNALQWNIHNFMNFDARTANFNTPEFIAFITEAQAMTHPEKAFGYTHSSNVYDPERMTLNSHRYLFQQQFNAEVYQFLMPFEEQLTFSGRMYQANERGQILINSFPSYAINGRATPEVQALAWSFIRFTMDYNNHIPDFDAGFFPWVNQISVYRPLLRFALEGAIPGWMEHFEEEFGWRPVLSPEDAVEHVYQIKSELANMPLADGLYYNNAVNSIIWEVMQQFHDGLVTAEQAAADLQNRVGLALLEIG